MIWISLIRRCKLQEQKSKIMDRVVASKSLRMPKKAELELGKISSKDDLGTQDLSLMQQWKY